MEFHPTLGKEKKQTSYRLCNVNDYLSVMKTLCIHLYRTVETETMMNSIVYIYIRIMVKCIFTNIHVIGSNRTCL